MPRAKRVALVGLDGIIPEFAAKFIAEGAMPNLERLRDRGFWTDATPCVPAWTPGNWATIATGAQTSTHGIEGFEVHLPGEPLPFAVFHRGFDSELNRAETIWHAAARAGRKAIILKYPGTWPIQLREGEGIQVGGAAGFGGLRSYLDIWHAHCFTNLPGTRKATAVTVAPARGWQHLPSTGPAFEFELPIEVNHREMTIRWHGLICRTTATEPYDTVLICRSRDAAQPLLQVRSGQWSDWAMGTFTENGQLPAGGFRVRVVVLSPDGQQIKLYMTPNHPLHGYTFPDDISSELLKVAGPFFEYESLHCLQYGWTDHDSQLELYALHTEWLSRAAAHLMRNHDWDIFVTQHHPIDYTQHLYMGAVCPSHPDYNEADVTKGWDGLRRTYQIADSYLGAVMDAAGEDTVVVMSGDHGAEVLEYIFYPNNVLEQAGLLKVRLNANGEYEPVWSETKAYAFGPSFVYVNLAGRDPDGIVQPGAEYEAVRDRIIALFRGLRCVQTDVYPVSQALRRENADAFGVYGDGVGDIIYIMEPGYDSGAPVRMGKSHYRAGVTEDREIFKVTRQWHDYTGDHSAFPPYSARNRTLVVMAGPGVRRGVKRRTPVRLIDVAPTMSHLIGAPFAAQTEGSVILDALDG